MADDSSAVSPDQPESQPAGSAPEQGSPAAPGSGRYADTEGGGNNKLLLAAIAAVVVIALAVGAFLYFRKDAPAAGPNPATSAPSSQSGKPASTNGAAATVPAGCAAEQSPMIDPKTFAIDRMKVKTTMLSLGRDSSGAAAAPPLDDLKKAAKQVGWFDEGPKLGAAKGNAVLTIHTYHTGDALGNQLYDAKNGLKVGDLIRITDSTGKTLCYTYERSTKVMVKDYDPTSNVLYDYEGKPQAVIVICWDYVKSTREWDSRILYYLKPVGTIKA